MRPSFEFYLDLWLVRFHTAVWRDALEMDTRDYFVIVLEFWRRKFFKFRLYETGESIYRRRALRHSGSKEP